MVIPPDFDLRVQVAVLQKYTGNQAKSILFIADAEFNKRG